MKKIILLLISISLLFVFSCASDKTEGDGGEKIESSKKAEKKLQEPEDFEEPLVRDYDPETQVITGDNPRPRRTRRNTESSASSTTASSDSSKNTTAATENKDASASTSTTTGTKEAASEKTAAAADNTKKTTTTTQSTTSAKTTPAAQTNTAKTNAPKANTNTAKNTAPTATQSAPRNTLDKKNTPTPAAPKQTTPSAATQKPAPATKKSDEFFVMPEGWEETTPEKTPVQSDLKPVPSRSVTMKTNETLSITYPGSGWIYLGSTSEYNNLNSTGKRTINDQTVFTLVSKESGKQVHHFYKLDNLTGKFIDDYIEVEVLDSKGSLYTVVQAPEYKTVVPKQPETPAISSKTYERLYGTEENSENAPEIAVNPNAAEPKDEVLPNEKRDFETFEPEEYVPNVAAEEENLPKIDLNPYTEIKDASALLEKARQLMSEQKYAEAELCLKAFFETSTEKRDEGLYLLGQLYEQDSPVKNIKGSINSYQNLMDNYPESNYYEEANKRIIYLKRFYIEIR